MEETRRVKESRRGSIEAETMREGGRVLDYEVLRTEGNRGSVREEGWKSMGERYTMST